MNSPDLLDDAIAAWDRGDPKAAYRLLLEAAHTGDRNAFLNLAYCYDVGLGTHRSYFEAQWWYRRADELGDSAAATNIAIALREAGCLRKSYEWFHRATRIGDGDADIEVAKAMMVGRGVSRNRKRAIHHLNRALRSSRITESGREEAHFLLRRVLRRA